MYLLQRNARIFTPLVEQRGKRFDIRPTLLHVLTVIARDSKGVNQNRKVRSLNFKLLWKFLTVPN